MAVPPVRNDTGERREEEAADLTRKSNQTQEEW